MEEAPIFVYSFGHGLWKIKPKSPTSFKSMTMTTAKLSSKTPIRLASDMARYPSSSIVCFGHKRNKTKCSRTRVKHKSIMC